jgi:hypothetical protein
MTMEINAMTSRIRSYFDCESRNVVPTCPAATVRVEAVSNLTATVSFALIEVGAGR